MASELKVDKFTGVTTAGSILVTGEGNSTTTSLAAAFRSQLGQLFFLYVYVCACASAHIGGCTGTRTCTRTKVHMRARTHCVF